MALTVIEPELLLFVSVTFCVLLVPTISLPKSSDVELAESCRVGAVPLSPLPVSDIRDGEIFTLLESERVPFTVPGAEGRNVTLKLADCPRDKVTGRAGPAKLKLAPVTLAPETVASKFPVFVTTMT